MAETALDILEKQAREKLRRLDYALGVDDDGIGGMFSISDGERMEAERRDAQKTLELIKVARASGAS